jgi:hypothetical protein
MLTGHHAFDGPTLIEVLASVLKTSRTGAGCRRTHRTASGGRQVLRDEFRLGASRQLTDYAHRELETKKKR